MNRILIYLSVFILLFNPLLNSNIYAQLLDTTVVIDEVVVSAGKIPLALTEVPRSITIISQSEIKNSPVQNIQDLLSNYSGIDVKKRGPEGVQADVSVRGGSFEQTLILIDGVKVSDPQTAHHNLNLPINFNDVERIEILKGQASSIYGPNAVSGIINIISKKGTSKSINASLEGGSSAFYQGALSLHLPFSSGSSLFSFSKSKSDGYRHNTGFDIMSAYANSSYQFNSGNANFSAGYIEKKFGSNGFYSAKYPDQWEELKTFLTSAGVSLALGGASITPKVFWRNNRDYYLLDYTRPAFYKNTHETNSYGFELQSVIASPVGSISLGSEYVLDKIVSSNLGNHQRTKGGISANIIASPINNLKVVFGGFGYYYDTFGMKFWPGLDLSYLLSKQVSVYSSVGKSFRIPTFTELYYSSPAQIGNSNLQPEESVSYEAGFNYYSQDISSNIGFFIRKGNNLIDWVKDAADAPWRSENITVINTKGFDLSFTIFPDFIYDDIFIRKIKLSYTYLQSDIEKNTLQSQYVLDHLRHQFVSEFTHILPFNTLLNWILRYEARFNQDDYFVTDIKFSLPVSKSEFYISVTNLFNKSYLDISGIPMPGRWIKAGLSYRLDSF